MKLVNAMTEANARSGKNKGWGFYWTNSWRMLWRDWRGGELNILAIGLVIAVSSITAVGFFTDRIERGLQMQSAELIAADLVLTSGRADINDHIATIRANDFLVTTTQQFRSIVLVNERLQLAEVKVVSEGYPLRGVLRISDTALVTMKQPLPYLHPVNSGLKRDCCSCWN